MDNTPMEERDIVALLKDEYDAADNYRESELRENQEVAISFYNGELFGNETEGQSQVVLPYVQEVVDYMVSSTLRLFISGDRVVDFDCREPEYDEIVEEITEAVNFIFMREQDGYRILHDWLKSGLIERIGAVKTGVDTVERVERQTVQATAEDLLMAEEAGDEIESAQEIGEGLYQATIKRTVTKRKFVDVAIPNEELRFSPRAKHEDESNYIAHVCIKTRSDLVEMGFDVEQVYDLPKVGFNDIENLSRNDYILDTESSTALERVELLEEYAKIDIDGDGIAERVKVFRSGEQILKDVETGELSIETVTEQPIVIFTPFPRPHRLDGFSLADKALDLQLIKSTVARQLMDGLRLSNMPRTVVSFDDADTNTMDDLLSAIPGAPIRVKRQGAVQPLQTGFNASQSLAAMEFFAGEGETRTGITRLNQGLDADTLNKTATGAALMSAQGQQIEEFVARNFAECFARLLSKKVRLMKAEAAPIRLKVNGEYKEADPSQWPEELDCNIRVGLGSNSKEKRIQGRMMLLTLQREGKQIGLVNNENLFANLDGLVRDMGLGKGQDYFNKEGGAQEQQPNPEAQAAMAKVQMEQQKAEGQMQLARNKAELEQELARDKAEFEAQMAEKKFQFEQRMAMLNATVNVPDYRPGGDLDK